MTLPLSRRLATESVATAFLVAAVVGSGIMAERLNGGSASLCLLENTIATAAALVALILAFGPASGAHLNPVVSLASGMVGRMPWTEVAPYICAQVLGGIAGVCVTHMMFGLPAIGASHHTRTGPAQFLSECVATFGLLVVIEMCARVRPEGIAYAVGAYIAAAYWFTASTAFANPALTISRSLSDTFAGIRPSDVTPFIVAQLLGGLAAVLFFRWLLREAHRRPNELRASSALEGTGETESS
jgi:glycerol uptake facilitator-like aquaporin